MKTISTMLLALIFHCEEAYYSVSLGFGGPLPRHHPIAVVHERGPPGVCRRGWGAVRSACRYKREAIVNSHRWREASSMSKRGVVLAVVAETTHGNHFIFCIWNPARVAC